MVSETESVREGAKVPRSRNSRNTLVELRTRFERTEAGFKRTEASLEKFWKVWQAGYLNCLRERSPR